MLTQPWTLRRPLPPAGRPWLALASAWGLGEAAARLVWLRGLERPEDLAWRLDPTWQRSCDPFLMPDMDKAVARIRQAIERGEGICVYGDYDVDGVTATALLVRVLERLGARADWFIPNRFDDGYGLHLDCIRELAARGRYGLLVSVDCGIRSATEVQASRELGLDWIITDHHALGAELPDACAVLHPARGENPSRHLAGAGVAFKLAQALLDAVPTPRPGEQPLLDGLLKLVAIGTVADMVPLTGENALLVKRGLQALAGGNSPGLRALLRAARVEGAPRAEHVAFGIGPRLNAVGRMGGAGDAVRLLLAREEAEASLLMEQVERLNIERRATQRELALRLPAPPDAGFDLVVDPSAHKGVVGIVAGQRMRDTGLPTAVCAVMDGVAHCSLRAPEGYDLAALLEAARPFLRSGGGHRLAAGMSFDLARLPFVRECLQRGAAAQGAGRGPRPMRLDGRDWRDLPSRGDLERLEPFGQGFPEAQVAVEGRLLEAPQAFGQEGSHLRMRLEGLDGSVTCFFAGERGLGGRPGDTLRLALSPQDHPRFGRSWRAECRLGDFMDPQDAGGAA